MPRQLNLSDSELIDRAMQVFWVSGYRATTPQTLANELNVSVSTVYNKYGKEELFRQSLESYTKGGPDHCIGFMRSSDKGLEAIREIQYLMIDSLTEGSQPHKCLVVNTVIEMRDTLPDIKEIYHDYFKGFREAYKVALERAHTLGEIKNRERIPEYVELIVGILFALNVLSKLHDNAHMRRYVDQQLALIT